MATATTTENFLGRCKECDYVIFATREDTKIAENFREVTAGTGVYKVGNNGFFARCTNRHKFFAVKRVKGTYSADHKCDSRCLNAKGWSCTCSCGGANHGRGHVATIVQAADLVPLPANGVMDEATWARREQDHAQPGSTAGGHLGEVGKYITGAVVIDFKRKLDAATLYTFRAVADNSVIKWFAPDHADPDWTVRKPFTIRAKVKAHGEFRGVPETIVIYVEEVK